MAPWTQKYAPSSIKEVHGQKGLVEDLLHYVRHYKDAKKKAVLLHGPPGCGKTSTIHAIAQELGLEVFEVNASDTRNKASIEEIVGNAATTVSLFGGSKLILIDEVDGIAGNKDRGGVQALIKLMEQSKFPMIMTCNDPFDKKFNSLRSKCKVVSLNGLAVNDVVDVLKEIAEKEEIEYEESAIKAIARASNGDLRGAINDLEALTEGSRKLTLDDVPSVGEREYVKPITESLLTIFKHSDFDIVRHAFDGCKEDLDQALLWMDYNVSKEYRRPGELFRAHQALALADLNRGRIRKRQYWRLLVYVNLFLTCGVSAAKLKKYDTEVEYKQTSRLLKIWQANMKNAKRKSIAQKLGVFCHTSSKRAYNDILPYFKLYAKANQKKATHLFEKLDLSKDEVDWILTK